MANEIKTKLGTLTTFSITLLSLGDGSARSTAEIDNTTLLAPAALIYVELTSVATPTAGELYEVYLLRSDNDGSDPIRTDNWAGTNAALTVENAQQIGVIVVTASVGEFRGIFDTWPYGPLGPKWGIGIKNESGAALGAEADSFVRFVTYLPEVQ